MSQENQSVVTPQTDFDWDAFESGASISKAEQAAMQEMYINSLSGVSQHEVVEGTVVAKTDREVIVDINAKSEGVVSISEFRYNPSLAIGDKVEVFVEHQENKTGQLVLSHKKARSIKAWDRVNAAYESGEIVNGFVKCRTKGGMIVDVLGIEAFLPGSQIDVKPIRDYDQFVEKTMEFKIVKINHDFKNVVISHKALIEADIEIQKKEIVSKLEKGQVLEGTVKNITSYGVFIDLGGVDGLVHITDLSWSRINHPSEVVELDQKINVVILDFDEDKTRIQLGLKQLQAHPWDALSANYNVGDKIKGKVVVLADYGAFVEVMPGVEGLIHVSEMSWSTHLRSAQDFVHIGDEIEAVILTIDRDDRKMSLGVKQLSADPWANIAEKYPVNSTQVGTVRNFTNFGIFVELEEGIDGLVYISDLSWTKKIKHPSEFCKIGDKLEVIVLELDTDARRLSLGHKQTTENPWDVYEKTFALGSVHSGTVREVFEKGATVGFEGFEGIEAFCPPRHLVKEDGSTLAKGEVADFKVIEFNKEFKRIVVSHTSTFKEEEERPARGEAKESRKQAPATSASTDTAPELKSTLGDFDALVELKKKMDAGK